MDEITTKIDNLNVKSGYKPVKLKNISKDMVGEKVHFFGWVSKCRAQKNVSFMDIVSGYSTIKAVFKGCVKHTIHTSLHICGEVKENLGKDKSEFEIVVDSYEIYLGKQAPVLPIASDSNKDDLLKHGHLAIRFPERRLFLEARSALLKVIREYFDKKEYTEVTPPVIVQTQVEGGATLFKVDYYGKTSYLTQSSQLYLETVAPVVGSAYCIMPSFRAEKSYTNRHLTEYTHVEAEVTDIDFEGLMDGIEDLMKFVTKRFYEVMIDKIKQVYPEFIEKDSSEAPYLRVSHKEAIDFLIKKEHKKPNGECYKQGDDISDSSERFLVKEMSKGRPMFLTNFPIEHKPFYVKRSDSSVYACDLLAAGVGEILGGSMREDDYEKLIEGFEREKINPEPYYWYLDLAKYGPSSHGGWGLGFERLLCTLMSYDHIDKACLYPRKPDRCTP